MVMKITPNWLITILMNVSINCRQSKGLSRNRINANVPSCIHIEAIVDLSKTVYGEKQSSLIRGQSNGMDKRRTFYQV